MANLRDRIRAALGADLLGVRELSQLLSVSHKAVSTSLSAMKLNTKEVEYVKEKGSPGKYRMRVPKQLLSGKQLKLSQLRTHRLALLKAGVSLVDDIIADYEQLIQDEKA